MPIKIFFDTKKPGSYKLYVYSEGEQVFETAFYILKPLQKMPAEDIKLKVCDDKII